MISVGKMGFLVVSLWYMFVSVWLSLLLPSTQEGQVEEGCHEYLTNFADVAANFTSCAIQHSRPFQFCCKCQKAYVSAVNKYRAIVGNKHCYSDLVMAEQHQIVESANGFVVNLWKSSHCPDCFQEDGGSVKEEITEFFEKWEAVQHCFLNNSRIHLIPVPTNGSYHNISGLQSVCDDCRNSYSYLEESYKKIARSDTEEFKVCADVSASMNYTRHRWSNTFHCVKIQNDLVSVVALTVFFCFLPVIFYSAVRLQGTSNDRKTKNMRATLT